MMKQIKFLTLLSVFVMMLFACSTDNVNEPTDEVQTVEEVQERVNHLMTVRDFENSKEFEMKLLEIFKGNSIQNNFLAKNGNAIVPAGSYHLCNHDGYDYYVYWDGNGNMYYYYEDTCIGLGGSYSCPVSVSVQDALFACG